MSVAKIKLDESAKLEFGVQITGAEGKPNARFVVEGPDMSVSYPCHRMSGGGIEVEVGNLKNVFPAGEYPVRLEIIIENKIFVPFEDTIILEPNVHVTTKPQSVKEVKESVQVGQVVVKPQPKAEPKPAKEQISEQRTVARKQNAIAQNVAELLRYEPVRKQSAVSIVNESLKARGVVSKMDHHNLLKLLKEAKQNGIDFDVDLLNPRK